MTTEFTVRGTHRAFQSPERGTVRVTLGFEGPKAQPVYDRVARDLEKVQRTIKSLHDPDRGPVTWWSTKQVRTWAKRPWNQSGKQLPLVHHATVGLEVKFSDFAQLSAWVGQHAGATDGFSLEGVDWALTATHRRELEREVRTRAVQDAARRAQEYADALGLGPVRAVAIADAGMLDDGISPHAAPAGAFMRGAAAQDAGGELELSPDDIEISAQVDARFVAD